MSDDLPPMKDARDAVFWACPECNTVKEQSEQPTTCEACGWVDADE